jgi:hypothetical protein
MCRCSVDSGHKLRLGSCTVGISDNASSVIRGHVVQVAMVAMAGARTTQEKSGNAREASWRPCPVEALLLLLGVLAGELTTWVVGR